MDVSAGEEQQNVLFSKAFGTHPQYPVIITRGIKAGLIDDKVGGKLYGTPGVVISRIKSEEFSEEFLRDWWWETIQCPY